jgi:hypothetical protein
LFAPRLAEERNTNKVGINIFTIIPFSHSKC